MKIELVPANNFEAVVGSGDAKVVVLEVSGPMDPQNAVVLRARELVRATGSAAMLESFDWAMGNEALSTRK